LPTRREAIQVLGGAMVGAVGLGPVSAACATPRGDLERIGVQLYTVRGEMQRSVEATLARVAAIGYREVEFAGYFQRTPEQIRAALDDTGLTAPSAHVPLEVVREQHESVFDAARVMGHRTIVVPWIAEAERQTLDGYRRVAESFNRIGELARSAGLTFAYHNHDFEFAALEGGMGYDVLLAETDAQLVQLEMDLYWITRGGADPFTYFERYPGRFPLVHVKDMDANRRMVDVGKGTIEFAAIFARSEQAGIRHYYVEHDQPGDAFASIEASYRHLRTLRF
jgi:sugar phosphate isomerase/epimerase